MTNIISLIIVVCTGMIGQAGTAEAQASYTVLHAFTLPTFPSGPQSPTGTLVHGSDGAFYGVTPNGGAFNRGTVFKLAADGTGFTTLHIFTGPDGAYPQAPLFQGSNGALYGTTSEGGPSWNGTVFKLAPDGTAFTTLHSFIGPDGVYPRGGLIQGSDGALYGTTSQGGGALGVGTVFKLAPDGTGFSTLHSFPWSEGAHPSAGLVQGADGALYGTTLFGGTAENGTVFKLTTDGTGFTTLHAFSGPDGGSPQAGLVQGADGALYGTTYFGGSGGVAGYGYGTVFKLGADGTGFTTLHFFSGSDGRNSLARLVQGADGTLYGTTVGGGTSQSYGTVFKLNADGTGFTTLHFFAAEDGNGPAAALVLGSDGVFYGTTSQGGPFGGGTVFKLTQDGTGFSRLHSFTGPCGGYPSAGLVQGSDGALYGTTGSSAFGSSGVDTVFKLAPDGTGFTTLHMLTGALTEGRSPSTLVQGADGAFYGTTSDGGFLGGGSVFTLKPDGTGFTTLHTFTWTEEENWIDGQNPAGALIQGTDGALYGTTIEGGPSGHGTVFKLAPDGTGLTVLHFFTGLDGDWPLAGLIQGGDGALYGTTGYGGASGWGTVFKLAPDGTGFSTLHSFAAPNGVRPSASLVQGADGALYGTTGSTTEYLTSCQFGPCSFPAGSGTVFKLNLDGTGFTVLHAFTGLDGSGPSAALLQGSDGALYGTTMRGGPSGHGTVFKLNLDGTGFTVLHAFTGLDGSGPSAALVQGSDGGFYGTTSDGGPGGGGVVFVLQPIVLPTVILKVNEPSFHVGQHLTLTATVTPSATSMTFDVYMALQLPDGSLRFLQGGGSLTTAVQPFVAHWPVGPFNGQIFSHTFGGGEPTGSYTWLAAFTQPGTLNFIGPIVSAPFSFSP